MNTIKLYIVKKPLGWAGLGRLAIYLNAFSHIYSVKIIIQILYVLA